MAWHKTSAASRGYGTTWRKLRAMVLARDSYLCQACLAKGRPTPATQVDHIVPKAKGGTDGLDNLSSICTPCHQAKTITEKGGRVRTTIGVDGWPVT